jgi:hypothetical protein
MWAKYVYNLAVVIRHNELDFLYIGSGLYSRMLDRLNSLDVGTNPVLRIFGVCQGNYHCNRDTFTGHRYVSDRLLCSYDLFRSLL